MNNCSHCEKNIDAPQLPSLILYRHSAPSGAVVFSYPILYGRSAPSGVVVICPFMGNISLKNIISYVCSAPIGAGEIAVNFFYRHFAPSGAVMSSYSILYRYFAPSGAVVSSYPILYGRSAPNGVVVTCPVMGNISLKNSISYVCSAPIGAGEIAVNDYFYRYFAPSGAVVSSYSIFYGHFAPKCAVVTCPVMGNI